ncbi:MAG: histidine kinase [Epsilonproteobacteria bacterium (ex Lamellibrachia satsuma)]|nr:MAG: histidine kinase [Epsilonproteobacteria bacterium (ex Lamellibrachia satsuma)]
MRTYLEENLLIRSLINELQSVNIQENFEFFKELFSKLGKVELHFARKENQLFPYLEKHGWTSPSQNMWAFHDQIRDEIKEVRKAIEDENIEAIIRNSQQVFRSLEHIMQVEEGRLLPNAMNMLSEEEWKEFKEGDKEIGWMFDTPPTPYPADEYIHPGEDTKRKKLPFGIEDKTHYDEGYLTPEQVNSIFRILPVDITYVNENDQVVFYNRGDDRVFPRSAGIIGREVKFCHPPKSVDQVLRILEEFKAGRQDLAEFWIQFKGKFIHIQYFAVRDPDGTYRGVIEMSQDVTHVRGLEGEQRLLDWDSQ